MLKLDEIPSDLSEMIDEVEHICGNYSKVFEQAMIDNGLMKYGYARRSHRIITTKCEELGYSGTVSLLTGLSELQITAINKGVTKALKIKRMFDTARECGYTITKDIS